MNIDERLEALKKIQRLDAPAFLLTRIRERIASTAEVMAPAQWKWTFAIAAVAMMMLNAALFFKNVSVTKQKSMNEVVSAMEMSSSNELYE